MNLECLEKKGIARIEDAQRILQLIEIDPGSTLTKMRVIIGKIISFIYKRNFPSRSVKLSDMIYELNKKNAFPPFIYIYLNTLRLAGNIGAHEKVDSKKEVEAVLPIFIRVIEWFVNQESRSV